MSLPPLQNSNYQNIDLVLIEEISLSILSNLDRDSLLNSIISMLHQIFGFSRVNIYTSLSEDHSILRKIGISQDGLEPESIYYLKADSSPVDRSITQLKLIVIDDTRNNSTYSLSQFDKFSISVLVLPLLQANQLYGALELCADSANAFTPEAVKILQHLAANIAIALRNASLYRSEQVKRMISDRLRVVIGPISADRTIEDIANQVLEELAVFLAYEAAAIWLMKPSQDDNGISQFTSTFRLAAFRSTTEADNERFDQYSSSTNDNDEFERNYPWITEVLSRKIPLITAPPAGAEPLGSVLEFAPDYSAIAAALLINDQPIGLLVCADRHPHSYDGDSLTVMEAFSDNGALAIENARLFTAAHDQAWTSTVVLQVADATQSITSMDELLETIVNIVPGLIGVEACSIYLWDPSFETFFEKASSGFDAEQTARLKAWDIPAGSCLAFDELRENRSPVILSTDTISASLAEEIFPKYDLDKDLLIIFPLLTQNLLCGAILFDFTNSDLEINSTQDAWDEKYTLIEGAAHQAATAIENLQLIKSQEEEAYISVALLQVAQAVVSLKELDEILATIVRITPILVGVRRCLIYLWDARDQVFRQSQLFGFSKNDLVMMGQVIKANEFPMIEAIRETDRVIYHSLGLDDTPASWNELTASEYHVIEGIIPGPDEEISIKLDESSFAGSQRLLIGFPLSVKNENLGVMLIEEEDPIKGLPSIHIREKRIEIVKGITQQAAIAIKNEQLQQEAVKSERLERELQLAREIQATFLPNELPNLEGWDIDARWQPARQVGGDFYDILPIDDHRMAFVIADVADKGMPAALFMTLIRTLIRAAANLESSPAKVLKQVNELLIPDSKESMFVTVFYCLVDLDSGSFSYANAGHNPPILKRAATGKQIELTRTSIALGLFSDIKVEERKSQLKPGDWLLLYTDGITEAFSIREEMYGIERLNHLVAEKSNLCSKELLDLIIDDVNEFIQGTDLSDDVTMFAVHRLKPKTEK